MQLVIGNKLYSSWSMRPWLVMKAFGIDFEEILIPLDQPDTAARRESHAPSPTVPILIDGDIKVWESLAIMEYLADRFPDKPIWPADIAPRAHARILASELHAGFGALRSACPMNFGKRFAARDRGQAVAQDVARIDSLMTETRSTYGRGGDFLFGSFGAVDAMYAPIASRFFTYDLPAGGVTQAYFDALLAHPHAVAWRDAGLAEPWVLAHDEVDEAPVEIYRRL